MFAKEKDVKDFRNFSKSWEEKICKKISIGKYH